LQILVHLNTASTANVGSFNTSALQRCFNALPFYLHLFVCTQTCIRNLIGSWPVKRCGAAFSAAPGTKTSLDQFRRDTSNTRLLPCCFTAAPLVCLSCVYAQTCIRNLIGSWPVKRCGAAFSAAPGTKTSLDQFRRDPSSLRIELQPIRDDTSNLEMHFSFQVG
jgi:hypothetical protein